MVLREQIKGLIRKTLSTISPTLCSKLLYYRAFRRKLDLQHPQTLNEKLMWLKLNEYEKNPLVVQCADKYRVRDYVKAMGCGEILNELYGVYERPEDIPWDKLPQRFVLKCNHGCGYNILCRDRSSFDRAAATRMLKRWMREDYWRVRAELNYKGIQKRIICEAYLAHDDDSALEDYKLYCFHGKPYCIMTCIGREKQDVRFYFFNRDWELLRINPDSKAAAVDFSLPRPPMLEQMFRYAEILSAPFSFVRVDLYAIEKRVVFGELTFTPSSALDTHRLPETDLLFGSLLNLPMQG